MMANEHEQQQIGALTAACAKEVSAYILAYAQNAGLDAPSFLVNVAAVLASSALAAQPEDHLSEASRHIQDALGLVHCLRGNQDGHQH